MKRDGGSMVTYTLLYIHAVLHHACRAENLTTVQRKKKKKKNQVKQRFLTLSLTSARYSLAPGIHFTAQIEWAASKWSEVEQPCALIKNRSGSCISSTNFAENICEDVIIVTAAPTDRECHHDYIWEKVERPDVEYRWLWRTGVFMCICPKARCLPSREYGVQIFK